MLFCYNSLSLSKLYQIYDGEGHLRGANYWVMFMLAIKIKMYLRNLEMMVELIQL